MVDRIDTPVAFFALGIGAPVLLGALTRLVVQRRGTPVEQDPDAAARMLAAMRRPRSSS